MASQKEGGRPVQKSVGGVVRLYVYVVGAATCLLVVYCLLVLHCIPQVRCRSKQQSSNSLDRSREGGVETRVPEEGRPAVREKGEVMKRVWVVSGGYRLPACCLLSAWHLFCCCLG